jgi:hypothetical protein
VLARGPGPATRSRHRPVGRPVGEGEQDLHERGAAGDGVVGAQQDRATGSVAVDEVRPPQRPRGVGWAVGPRTDLGVQLVVTARRGQEDAAQVVTDVEARDVGPAWADEPEGDRGSTTRCAKRGNAGTSRSASAAVTLSQFSGSSNQETQVTTMRCGEWPLAELWTSPPP